MSNCCEELKREISELRTVISRLESQLNARYVTRSEFNSAVNSLNSRFVTQSAFISAISSFRSRLSALERCTGCGSSIGGGGSSGGGGLGGNNNQTRDVIERVFRDKRWIAATDCLQFIIKGKV